MSPMSAQKVILAMSGGVDSSVAAHLLQRDGYEVTGVFMCLGAGPGGDPDDEGNRPTCCSPEAADDARRVARKLGLAFYVLDFAREFDAVIEYFAAEYALGRTPNPCARCNEWLKFGKLLTYADAAGAQYVATGHYARVDRLGRPCIHRARDAAKDQSYVLFGIPEAALARVLLPVGEMVDKAALRDMARDLALPVADKPDSQDVCFLGEEGYVGVLRQRAPESLRPGPIVGPDGRRVGTHQGIGRYTLGQRRGLGVAVGEPMYVTAIDAAAATVTIGPRAAADGRQLAAGEANWHADVGDEPFDALVQIRYNHRARPARVHPLGTERFTVEFDEALQAITPGQIAAVYDGDRLLGGGWIESAG